MKRTICLLLGFSVLSVSARAQDTKTADLTDPLEILKKVDTATKAVKAVKYKVSFEATGVAARMFEKAEASFIVSGEVNGAPEKYLLDAKITLPGSAETRRLTAGSDNDMFYVVDHRGKIAYEDLDSAVIGAAVRVFQQIGMIEFIHPTPFNDEIGAKSRELRGSKTIGGEECYEIQVVYAADRAPAATWCFSKKDFLPRQRIDTYNLSDGRTGKSTKTITSLVVNPKVTDATFTLKLPQGFTKTDDFAPNLLAP